MENKGKKDRQSKNSGIFRELANFSQIGVTMAATVLTGVLAGKFLDVVFGTRPWLLLVFSLLGAGAAIKLLFNLSKDRK